MASPARDIRGSLILTPEQDEFMGALLEFMPLACKEHVAQLGMLFKPGPGNRYSDYVITIHCSKDRRTCEVYRNRTGTLVFALDNGRVAVADWEITFVLEHLKNKLEKIKGDK